MKALFAIDPGDKHVGVAFFTYRFRGGDVWRWSCDDAYQLDAQQFLRHWLPHPTDTAALGFDTIVVEQFNLYPDKANAQTGSQMETAQMIGAIKQRYQDTNINLVFQPASIQTATAAICKARGINLYPMGPHARSAQLHGWYHILKTLGDKP